MAGIGFELRKYLDDDSFTGTMKAYGFAGLISAGPWVLSILGVMLIGIVAVSQKVGGHEVKQFTTSVTWVMGASLTLTGLLQLVFTRFIADRLFEGEDDIVNPNLFGAIMLTTLVSLVIGAILALTLFSESFAYEMLMVANFVTLSNVWIVVIFVAGLKRFKLILVAFGVGYVATVVLSALLMSHGLPGLLTGLLIGHVYDACGYLAGIPCSGIGTHGFFAAKEDLSCSYIHWVFLQPWHLGRQAYFLALPWHFRGHYWSFAQLRHIRLTYFPCLSEYYSRYGGFSPAYLNRFCRSL